jgi:hypothetical protein
LRKSLIRIAKGAGGCQNILTNHFIIKNGSCQGFFG